MTILAIDSSTDTATVALDTGAGAARAARFPAGRGADPAPLCAFLDETLRIGPPPDLLVAGLGPGSYSGTRIAISLATGLAIATGARLAGLPSALGLPAAESAFRLLNDARRGTLAHVLVRDGRCERGPELLDEAAARSLLDHDPSTPVYSSDPPEWLVHAKTAIPDAARLARAARAPVAPLVDGTRGLEPYYLRPPHITRPTGQTARLGSPPG